MLEESLFLGVSLGKGSVYSIIACVFTLLLKGVKGWTHEAFQFLYDTQVALERNAPLFVSDPTSVAGLEQNELMLNFGYSYYAGAPWTVGRNRGRYTSYLSLQFRHLIRHFF